ncbi:MAG: addiction module protein [bacterium]
MLVKELFDQACELDENDPATLAGLLLGTIGTEVDEDVEAAWMAEIEGRLAKIDSGSVDLAGCSLAPCGREYYGDKSLHYR